NLVGLFLDSASCAPQIGSERPHLRKIEERHATTSSTLYRRAVRHVFDGSTRTRNLDPTRARSRDESTTNTSSTSGNTSAPTGICTSNTASVTSPLWGRGSMSGL